VSAHGTAGAQSALRGLEVLEALAGLAQPATLATVAERAKLNEASAYRTLRRLEAEGYVDHVPRAGYRLGSRSIALAVLVGPDVPFLRTANRALASLAVTTGLSAAMHLRSGAHRVLTVGVPAPAHPLRDEVALGERAPLTSGSAGLVILAYLPEDDVDAMLTGLEPGEAASIRTELEHVRADGYRIGRRHRHASLRGVSAPLLDPASKGPLGSVTVAGLDDQATTGALRERVPVLLRACHDLAPQLAPLVGPRAVRGRRGLDVTVEWRD
jgi:DNA-binding IclR family transcriptional regulator